MSKILGRVAMAGLATVAMGATAPMGNAVAAPAAPTPIDYTHLEQP